MTTAWPLSIFGMSFTSAEGTTCRLEKESRSWNDSSKIANALLGGWSVNWSATLQGGQPITLSCPAGTADGTGCYDLLVGDPHLGLHKDTQGKLNWIGNASAFSQPVTV